MKLTGLDLRIVLRAIMVYTLAPENRPIVRRTLSSEEDELLNRLDSRIAEARDFLYEDQGTESAPSRAEVIRRRLSVHLDWAFSELEKALLAEILETCAREMDHGGDVNIHFNGEEYGVRAEHLRDLKVRLTAQS